MPDTEAPEEGTPGPDATQTPPAPEPVSGEQGQQPDYFDEKFDPASLPEELRPGWKQVRDAFSQKTQTLAEERKQLREAKEVYDALQDPDKQEEALRKLGLLEEDDDDVYEESDDPYEQRIAALEQQLAQSHQSAQQQAQEEAEYDYIVDGLTRLQETTGRKFTPNQLNALGMLAERVRDTEGNPDVQEAYEVWSGAMTDEREQWTGQKKAPQAARGSAASEVPDLDTPQGRVEYARARLAQKAAEDT